ncbi:MAG: TonB-dependent receptor plug domain-containing protein, partial [bacterium]|nr:TonB-dependent receptor plug domain-containing protein [bacterium]
MKKTILMLFLVFSSIIYGQSEKIKISGKLVDENNQPLPGASVLVKGTNSGAVTDFEGSYSILVGNASSTLTFTYIGYDQKEIAVGNQTTVNVKLTPTNNTLNEVVVVGYGTQKKSDVTGSVTSLSKERLSQLPVTNVLQSVQGAVAGVTVTQSSSAPGSGTSAQIRGASSISASTGPFIVLDGMPFSTTGGSLNDINPNDIESLEILKDASAVAIYGTRGANGVILITTKKGKSGKPVIKFNTYTGIEQFSNRINPMGPAEYVQKYADWKTQSGSR